MNTSRTRMLDRFYTTGQLGKTRSKTPEGYLVCEGVPIARTGVQLYGPGEIPIEPSKSGEIRIDRPPEEVFRPETLASFEGKAVTVNHPEEFVTPENDRELRVGNVHNVRRGTGIEDDFIIADLVITDPGAIAYVNEELPEVSCGYDADYEQTEPGRGTQRNIIGNHVALVTRGRAGPRVAIKDHSTERTSMATAKRKFWDRIRNAVKAQDVKTIDELESEEEGEGEGSMDARLRDAEAFIKECRDRWAKDEAEEKEEREKKERAEAGEAEDTIIESEHAASISGSLGKRWTGDTARAILSRAEIVSPGIAVPTGDSAKRKSGLHGLMVKALGTVDANITAPLLRGRGLATLDADTTLDLFNAVAEIIRVQNNKAMRPGLPTKTGDSKNGPPSPAEINAAAQKFWANGGK